MTTLYSYWLNKAFYSTFLDFTECKKFIRKMRMFSSQNVCNENNKYVETIVKELYQRKLFSGIKSIISSTFSLKKYIFSNFIKMQMKIFFTSLYLGIKFNQALVKFFSQVLLQRQGFFSLTYRVKIVVNYQTNPFFRPVLQKYKK